MACHHGQKDRWSPWSARSAAAGSASEKDRQRAMPAGPDVVPGPAVSVGAGKGAQPAVALFAVEQERVPAAGIGDLDHGHDPVAAGHGDRRAQGHGMKTGLAESAVQFLSQSVAECCSVKAVVQVHVHVGSGVGGPELDPGDVEVCAGREFSQAPGGPARRVPQAATPAGIDVEPPGLERHRRIERRCQSG